MAASGDNVPVLDEQDYHVFIAFSYKEEDIAEALTKHLRTAGLKVCICKEQFVMGGLVDNISQSIARSRLMVMLLSSHYIESDWFNYETAQILHHQKKQQRHMLIPIIMGVKAIDIPGRIKFAKNIYIEYDMEKDFTEQLPVFDKVTQACKAPNMAMSMSLPLDDIAQGFAWSYYVGYLQIVIPSFRERIMKTRYWKEGCPMAARLFILLPESGYGHPSITACDPSFEYIDNVLEKVTKDRAGTTSRPYINRFLSFTKPGTGQKYYCSVEYATPLATMYDMMKTLAAEGSEKELLTKEELRYQIIIFHQILDQIISTLLPMEQANSICLLQYKDQGEGKRDDLASLLAHHIDHYRLEEARAQREAQAGGGRIIVDELLARNLGQVSIDN